MPTKKIIKKDTKWTKRPYLAVSVDGGQKCILYDKDEILDFIENNSGMEFMKKPSESVTFEISVAMMTDKQMDNLPDWEG